MLDRWFLTLGASALVAAAMALAGVGTYFLSDPTWAPPDYAFSPDGGRSPGRAVRLPQALPSASPQPSPVSGAADRSPPPHRLVPDAPPGARFRIFPGETIGEVVAKLAADRRIAFDLGGTHTDGLMARLGLGHTHPEGNFLPGRYRVENRRTASELLREAHDRMRTTLADAWHRRDRGLPYATAYDALILASIVEKETARAEDRPRVAAVFTRRMHRGMRLQADPTVIYGLGARLDGPLTRTHLATDTPYNTYRRHGLPPTPISLPGPPAIHAALHPAPGTSLYFVARGDGSSHFSDTLAQHNMAVQRYLRRTGP